MKKSIAYLRPTLLKAEKEYCFSTSQGKILMETVKGDVLKEYISKGRQGGYYQRYHQRSNVVVLEPDMADAFPNAKAVNQALRSIYRVANHEKT